MGEELGSLLLFNPLCCALLVYDAASVCKNALRVVCVLRVCTWVYVPVCASHATYCLLGLRKGGGGRRVKQADIQLEKGFTG